ncbi:MAG: hypothetical protein AAF602_13680 [Myxococcota bacterium]
MLIVFLVGAAAAAPSFRAGILGEFLLHPGVFATVAHAPTSEGAWRPIVGARTGGYVHPGHHTAAFVHGEAGIRRRGRAVELDLMAGAGLHYRWLPAPVVVRDGDGLDTVLDGGRPNLLGLVGLRVGDADGTVRPFGRFDVWWRGPENRGLRTELVVALGIAFGGTP